MITPDGDAWLEKFIGYEILLEEAIGRKLAHLQQKMQWLRARLRHPKEKLEQQSQRCDALEMRLKNAALTMLTRYHNRLNTLVLRQKPLHPQTRLEQLQRRFKQAQQGLLKAQAVTADKKRQRFNEAIRMLNTLSPLKTLERGFAIVTHLDAQKPITHSNEIKVGDKLKAQVAKGEFVAIVESIKS